MRQLCFALPVWLSCAAAQAVEIMAWERVPLAVPLLVGQERIIFVDRNVRVGIPRSLTDTLRIQSTGGALYLRADAPIAPTRLQLQDMRTGEIILIDIAATPATDQSALEPVKIVKGVNRSGGGQQHAHPDAEALLSLQPTQSTSRETPIAVTLTRYAAQNLYAPLRTVEPLPGVSQIQQRRQVDLRSLMPNRPVSPTLLGTWQLDDYFVSAIKVRNTSEASLSLDPRELQGDFVTATFQHPHLGPNGMATDTTVVYLVTRGKGLAQSLPPAISQIDPRAPLISPNGVAHAQ